MHVERRLPPPPCPRRLLCLALASALLPSLAIAAEAGTGAMPAAGTADAAADPATTLDAVRVTAKGETESYTVKQASSATKLDMSLRQTPQSVTVITRQRLDDMGLYSLSDIMGQVTGVTVSVTDSERINYYSRGYAINNFQVDGMLNTFGGSVKTNTDSVIYDRIEVVRGATGLTTGAGDPSATINFVRKRPTETFQANVNLTVGRWSNQRMEADLGGPVALDGRIRARVVAAKQQSDSFREQYKLDKNIFYGIVQADLTDSTLLEAGYEYQSPETTGVTWGVVPYWGADGTPANLPRSTNLSASWSSWPIVEKTAFARVEQSLGNGWSIKASATRSKRDTDGSVWYGASGHPRADGTGVVAYISHFAYQDEMKVFDFNASGPFQLFGREHQLMVGVGQSTRDGYSPALTIGNYPSATYAQVPDWRNWTGDVAELPVTRHGRPSSESRLEQRAAYIAARLQLAEPLSAVVGARYGSWETSTWTYAYDSNGTRTRTTRSGYKPDDPLTPYVGIVYDINSIFSAYASYTDIFQPQNYRDKNNQYLEPVVGDNLEAGIKAELFGGRLNASAALFEGEKDNIAEEDDSVPVGSLPDGATAYRATGKGNKVKGWELEVQGSVTENWNLSAGYTHATTKNAEGVAQLTTVPVDTFRLNTSWRPAGAWNRLSLGGGVTWQSRIWRNSARPVAPGVTVSTPIVQDSHALLNLMAGYRVSDNVAVQLNINNLLDKKYYNNVGFYDGVYWGEPRNVTATLRWKL